MRVKLLNKPDPEVCAIAAGMCYNAADPWKALKGALKNNHESVIEHSGFSFLIEDVSRVLMAQLTRHRIASFSVQSQRYCGVTGEMIMPETIREACEKDSRVAEVMQDARDVVDLLYKLLITNGVPQEDARYYTFQAGTTRLVMTMNARELRHFFALRCCTRAQWEIRALANEMLKICKEATGDLFSNAGPGCVRGACPEGTKSCGRWKNDGKPD